MIYVSYGLIPELFFLFELYTEHTSYIYMLLLLLSGEILFLSNDKQEIIADSYLYLCVHWILSDSVECLYVQMLLFSIWRTTQLVISLCITGNGQCIKLKVIGGEMITVFVLKSSYTVSLKSVYFWEVSAPVNLMVSLEKSLADCSTSLLSITS